MFSRDDESSFLIVAFNVLVANIECPGMYHCPGSYCIPYDKVCDGSRDCPSGHDELQCSNYSCSGILELALLHQFN